MKALPIRKGNGLFLLRYPCFLGASMKALPIRKGNPRRGYCVRSVRLSLNESPSHKEGKYESKREPPITL